MVNRWDQQNACRFGYFKRKICIHRHMIHFSTQLNSRIQIQSLFWCFLFAFIRKIVSHYMINARDAHWYLWSESNLRVSCISMSWWWNDNFIAIIFFINIDSWITQHRSIATWQSVATWQIIFVLLYFNKSTLLL